MPDRYAEFLPSFKFWAAEADQIFRDSAADTGGSSRIRFVHDESCEPAVSSVVVSPEGDDNMDNTIADLKVQGFNRTDRKYMMFVDANVYCGWGTIEGDDRPGIENRANAGPEYGRNDAGCWNGFTAAHELMHNLGGVQGSAPNSSGRWHCVDEWDVMCYADSDTPGVPEMHYLCSDFERHATRFDCNSDDYFHSNPPAGSYLATHWNVYDSVFLATGAGTTCPDSGFEPDNTPGEARSRMAGFVDNRAFCAAGDEDWTALQVVSGRSYRIETLNPASGVGTTLELYAQDGTTLIQSAEDGEGDVESRLDFTAPADGISYLRVVQSGGGEGLGSTYQIRSEVRCPDVAFEPDDTPAQARTVAVGATETHAYCTMGDEDWVSFEASAGTVYSVQTLNLEPGVDTYLELYASDGTTLLAANNDAGWTFSSLINFTAATTGVHYVKSRRYFAESEGSNGAYDLRVSEGGTVLAIGAQSREEGDSGTTEWSFTVTRSGVTTGTSSVSYYTEDLGAYAPEDYIALPVASLSFAAGETVKSVVVTVNGDTSFEPDDLFAVRLSEPVNAVIVEQNGYGTIVNDDAPASFSVADVSVKEGDSDTRNAAFTITRTGDMGFAWVDYATADGTAAASSDYQAHPLTTLSFAEGQTSRIIRVTINGDTTVEPDETFQLQLSAPPFSPVIAEDTATGTIVNDDVPAYFSVDDTSVVERDRGSRNAVFTIRRSGSTARPASVKYATANGSAKAPSDYSARAPSTLEFRAGQAARTVAVSVKGDTRVEPNERFFLKLSAPEGAGISDDSGTGRILNDD